MKHLSFAVLIALTINACKKHDPPADMPPGLPQVNTAQVTMIRANMATGGGAIVSDGGAPVTASGICWSKTNPTPTLSDDTVKTLTASGLFSVTLSNLSSGATYYVRAYAINKAGTGYGSTVSFNSLNKVPEARNISIEGTVKVAEVLRARYTYFDAENDPERDSRFQWYVADDTIGAPVASIANGNGSSYTTTIADRNKFLRVGIVPQSSSGMNPGVQAFSAWVGPVGAPEPVSVTFTYNGQLVTYGILTSAATQRKWMDRNLGAPNVAAAFNDWANYGDLFQWGRKADGHQLVNRAATTPGTTGVNGTTTALSSSDNAANALFIVTSASPFDWHVPQNGDLWTGTSGAGGGGAGSGGTNNVCPVGWHIPTVDEWRNENLGNLTDAYNKLKITAGGMRNFNDGGFALTTGDGLYWTSSIFNSSVGLVPYSFNVTAVNNTSFSSTDKVNAVGLSVRCIKD